jgi:hypothetical protein
VALSAGTRLGPYEILEPLPPGIVEAFYCLQFAQNLVLTAGGRLLIDPAQNPETDRIWVLSLRARVTLAPCRQCRGPLAEPELDSTTRRLGELSIKQASPDTIDRTGVRA